MLGEREERGDGGVGWGWGAGGGRTGWKRDVQTLLRKSLAIVEASRSLTPKDLCATFICIQGGIIPHAVF